MILCRTSIFWSSNSSHPERVPGFKQARILEPDEHPLDHLRLFRFLPSGESGVYLGREHQGARRSGSLSALQVLVLQGDQRPPEALKVFLPYTLDQRRQWKFRLPHQFPKYGFLDLGEGIAQLPELFETDRCDARLGQPFAYLNEPL